MTTFSARYISMVLHVLSAGLGLHVVACVADNAIPAGEMHYCGKFARCTQHQSHLVGGLPVVARVGVLS